MKHFLSKNDVVNADELINQAILFKNDPFSRSHLGKNKTIGLVFFNSSLRTRLSAQKAAKNLGMEVLIINVGAESWQLEFMDGAIMNGSTVEHVKEGAAVIGAYCDIVGVRCFPLLQDRDIDYSEHILSAFLQYAGKPIVSLESATRHPLQSLADMMTIREHTKIEKPKIVLTWAPHPKALPQAVPNSFSEWARSLNAEFVITHPEGYELPEQFSGDAKIEYNQKAALENADFVYVKNWSSYQHYGQILSNDSSWKFSENHWLATNKAKVMHCLPVRRNIEITDSILDGDYSLTIHQAENRIWAAQAVFHNLLQTT